jgi:hypothetical protein
MACFAKDASSHSNHNFQTFLTPKVSSLTYNNNLPSLVDDDLPDLSPSIYTNSTYYSASLSSSSNFTRRAALARQKQEEEEEQIACCDFCENLNKKGVGGAFITLPSQKSFPFFISQVALTATTTTTRIK